MTTKYLDTIESVEGGTAPNHLILKSQNSQTEYRVGYSGSDSYAQSTSINKLNAHRDSSKLYQGTSPRQQKYVTAFDQHLTPSAPKEEVNDYVMSNSATAYKLPDSANSPNSKLLIASVWGTQHLNTTGRQEKKSESIIEPPLQTKKTFNSRNRQPQVDVPKKAAATYT